MRKFYTTLLLLMAVITGLSVQVQASEYGHTKVPLPWTPCLGEIRGSVAEDWKDYLEVYDSNTSRGWSYELGSGDWNFRCLPKATGTVSNPNRVAQDAYLFMPPMDFVAGECYVIKFHAYSQGTRTTGEGGVSLVLAQERSMEGARAGQIIMDTKVPVKGQQGEGLDYVVYFIPEKTGEQSIAFHCTSLGADGNLIIRAVNTRLSVKQTHLSLPAAPTNLTATPDPEGRKQATVKFNAPTLTIVGEPITEMTFIDICLDGHRVACIDAPVPGQEYTVDIKGTQAVPGEVSVYGGNTHGNGDPAKVNCTIGTPLQQPTFTEHKKVVDNRNYFWYAYPIKAVYKDGTVELNWEPTTVEGATYSIKRYPEGTVLAEGLEGTTFTDPEVKSDFPANFQYELITTVGERSEGGIYSNVIAINNEMPYQLSFKAPESIYEITIEDGDGKPFVWVKGVANKGCINTSWGDPNKENWAITPSVKLDPGKHYKVEIVTGVDNGIFNFQVKGGKSNSSEALDIIVLEEYPEKADADKGGAAHAGFFTVPEEGSYFFGINTWGEEIPRGQSVFSFKVTEVNPQLPGAVEDLNVTFDAEDPTKGKLTFNAPTKSVAGEDLQGITSIKVYKDGEPFQTIENPAPGAAQSFDIDVTLGEQIVYKVAPMLDDTEGVPVEIPVCILLAPYKNDFDLTKDLVGYTVIDYNQDHQEFKIYQGGARLFLGARQVADDWVITPPLHLEGGYFYKLQFTTGLDKQDDYNNSDSQIGMFMGRAATVEAMTQQVIEYYEPHGAYYSSAALLKDYVYIPETGEYYFGWHAKGNTGIGFDNFSISDKINIGVPDKTQDLTITPDKMGAMQGTISFTSPGVTLKGDPLYGEINYTVYRDGMPVFTTTTTPNKKVSFVDKGMEEGVHLYTVYPTNTYGLGREAENVAYFGINRPYVPENFDVRETDTYGTVLLTWDAPSVDYDGFPINPDLIRYDLFIYNPDDGTETPVAGGLTSLSYTHVAKSPTAPQAFIRYGIRARTSKGGSPGLLARFVNVGVPYNLPIKESFKGCRPQIAFLQEGLEGLAAWGYNYTDNAGVNNFDGDNGMAIMESAFIDSQARLFTGKIKIDGENPYMSMYIYNNQNSGDDLNELYIETGRPKDWKVIEGHTMHEWADGLPGWQKIRVDLSEYAGQVIQLAFRGVCKKYTFTHFDGLVIGNGGADDLSLMGCSAPRRVNRGEEFPLQATVKNNGLNDADIYTVRLYRGETLISTITGESLKPGESKVYDFTDAIDKNAEGEVFNYTFDLRYAPDCDKTDNRVENVSLSLRPADYLPMPENLTATVNNVTNISLNWDAPALPTEAKEITDSFEDFPAWATHEDILGEYINVDGDSKVTVLFEGMESLPIAQNDKLGFFIMDVTAPELAALNTSSGLELFSAHTGNHVIAAAGIIDDEAYTNDWLISPELDGSAQTIKFWARSSYYYRSDNVAFLTSTDGINFRDFELVGDSQALSMDWTEFSYDVPEGTKYFALRHQTINGMYLLIDDLTYTPAGPERLNLEGFIICHNGENVATVGKDATSFDHNGVADGDHNYAVAAKYANGESADATASVTTSGVDSLYGDGTAAFARNGKIIVTGAENLNVNIYDAAGTHLYSTIGNGTFPVQPGVYVVTVGKENFKVIVQ